MSAMLESRVAQLERICAHQQRQIAGLMQRKGTHYALARSTLNVNDSGAGADGAGAARRAFDAR